MIPSAAMAQLPQPPPTATEPEPEEPAEQAEEPEPAEEAEKATKADKKAALGTIRITSSPAANIVINGQPAGVRSAVTARVEPGTHVIAFVHSKHGRKVRTVRVEPGTTATAAVSFP
jgi:hypothetical protein